MKVDGQDELPARENGGLARKNGQNGFGGQSRDSSGA
jgi:hypothetical protein